MPESVQILNEARFNQSLPNGDFLQMVEITYQAVGLPPRRVFVMKDQDSPKERQRVIKADLDLIAATRPTRLDIP